MFSGIPAKLLDESLPRTIPKPLKNLIWAAPPKPLEFVLQFVIKMIVFVSRQASGSFGAVPGGRADKANILSSIRNTHMSIKNLDFP